MSPYYPEWYRIDRSEPGFVRIEGAGDWGEYLWFEEPNLPWVIEVLRALLSTYDFPQSGFERGLDNLGAHRTEHEISPMVWLDNLRPKDAPRGGDTGIHLPVWLGRRLLEDLATLPPPAGPTPPTRRIWAVQGVSWESYEVTTDDPGFVHIRYHQMSTSGFDMGGELWFERENLPWLEKQLRVFADHDAPVHEEQRGQDVMTFYRHRLGLFSVGLFVVIENHRLLAAPRGGSSTLMVTPPLAERLLRDLKAVRKGKRGPRSGRVEGRHPPAEVPPSVPRVEVEPQDGDRVRVLLHPRLIYGLDLRPELPLERRSLPWVRQALRAALDDPGFPRSELDTGTSRLLLFRSGSPSAPVFHLRNHDGFIRRVLDEYAHLILDAEEAEMVIDRLGPFAPAPADVPPPVRAFRWVPPVREDFAIDTSDPTLIRIRSTVIDSEGNDMGSDLWFEPNSLAWIVEALQTCLEDDDPPVTSRKVEADRIETSRDSAPGAGPFVTLIVRHNDPDRGGYNTLRLTLPTAARLVAALQALRDSL